jgi:hypothetical protein
MPTDLIPVAHPPRREDDTTCIVEQLIVEVSVFGTLTQTKYDSLAVNHTVTIIVLAVTAPPTAFIGVPRMDACIIIITITL